MSDLYLTLGCATGTWCSSLRGVFDIYFTLGCYPGPSSSSLRDVFDLYLMLGCFTGPWSSSTSKRCVWVVPYVRMLLMYLVQFTTMCVSLVHNVGMFPWVLSQALDEVCLTCTLYYDVPRVLGSALYEVCWLVPYVRMFHGYLVQLSTRYVSLVRNDRMFPRVLSQALDEMCWLVPYVRMFHGSLVQLSTRCVWLVPYVRMLHGSLVQLSTGCVWR